MMWTSEYVVIVSQGTCWWDGGDTIYPPYRQIVARESNVGYDKLGRIAQQYMRNGYRVEFMQVTVQ